MSVNLDGVFYCMLAEIGPISRAGGGSIINMLSVLGSVGIENSPAYVASKHGVVGLTKAAALKHAAEGVGINAVGPGFISTPLLGVESSCRNSGTDSYSTRPRALGHL
jgi:NAD(P)-dependent dehydrogenase (short-subunit alcohol dehydrogenase family)